MSEFSESYHLRTSDSGQAEALLHRVGRAGYVFPASNGWVTFVAEGQPCELDEALVAANTGRLVHYVHAEDHGWAFQAFDAQRCVAKHECAWEDELESSGSVDLAELCRWLDVGHGLDLTKLERRLFQPSSMEELFETRPPLAFAQAIGLVHYRWLSFDYLAVSVQSDHLDRPSRRLIEVEAGLL